MDPSAAIKYVVYFAPLFLIWLMYFLAHQRKQKRSVNIRDSAIKSGLTQPASLHPVIDAGRCLGCGACVYACPESNVLGVINGCAVLINPTHCIGHGLCKVACPEDAISLVFGTAERGVDIPSVADNFETNVPGLFIAGELGGMGLIRNAVEQGKRAMSAVRALEGIGNGSQLDVVIVGAGPAGLAASLAAKRDKLRFVTVEQDALGGTVAHFPRGKIVMTAPMELPLVGKIKMTETTKEDLLERWRRIEQDTGLQFNYNERVEDIQRNGKGFTVKTTRNAYQSRAVLLAIGRRGTPRKLGVTGEGLPKVVYSLVDPEQYRGKNVLVVGGGDSALEAAVSIAELDSGQVALSYRSGSFSRAKEKNRQKVAAEEAAGRLRVMMSSNVVEITPGAVKIDYEGQVHELPNDAVIICVGGILPTGFLKQIGIEVETKFGTA